MDGAVPPLPLYAFMVCKGMHFHVTGLQIESLATHSLLPPASRLLQTSFRMRAEQDKQCW